MLNLLERIGWADEICLDSSSIFQAIIENKVSVLVGNYTLNLAKYDLGNLVWKRRALTKDLEREECKRLMENIKGTLNLMEVLDIECHETEIVGLAESLSLSLTFYDASYIF